MSGNFGPQVVLNYDNDRLSAVAATVGTRGVVVSGWVLADRPAHVDARDAAALGAWIGEELRKAGLHRTASRGGVVFAVPRGEVVLKRLVLPPGVDEQELPGIVRLQMARQLTMASAGVAIDYVPLPTAPGQQGTATGPVVLAAALQVDRLDWRRQVVAGAGARLRRVTLKSLGGAALLGEEGPGRGAAVLGVALDRAPVEFVVVEDGRLVFARATDLVRPDAGQNVEAFAAGVAVEAKRTWMGYRVTPESAPIESVVVLGADEVGREVAAGCGQALELPSAAIDYPEFVRMPEAATPADRAAVASLVGLLCEPVTGRPCLDFANPRRAVDRAAALRQRVLAAALVLIVLAGSLYTVGKLRLERQRARLADLRTQWSDSQAEYNAYLRTQARAEHAEAWLATRADWLAHVKHLTEQMPSPGEALLDEVNGVSRSTIVFELPKGSHKYAEGKWQPRLSADIELIGSVKRREVADSLRQQLVDNTRYDQLDTLGVDLPTSFDFRLRTARPSPDGPLPGEAAVPAPAAPPSGGAAKGALPAAGPPEKPAAKPPDAKGTPAVPAAPAAATPAKGGGK